MDAIKGRVYLINCRFVSHQDSCSIGAIVGFPQFFVEISDGYFPNPSLNNSAKVGNDYHTKEY